LDVRVAQDRVEVARHRRAGQLPAELVELLLVEVADVPEGGLGQLVEIAGEVLAPAADAGDRDLHWIHAAHHPLCKRMISQSRRAFRRTKRDGEHIPGGDQRAEARPRAPAKSRHCATIFSAARPSPKAASTPTRKSGAPRASAASQASAAARILAGS